MLDKHSYSLSKHNQTTVHANTSQRSVQPVKYLWKLFSEKFETFWEKSTLKNIFNLKYGIFKQQLSSWSTSSRVGQKSFSARLEAFGKETIWFTVFPRCPLLFVFAKKLWFKSRIYSMWFEKKLLLKKRKPSVKNAAQNLFMYMKKWIFTFSFFLASNLSLLTKRTRATINAWIYFKGSSSQKPHNNHKMKSNLRQPCGDTHEIKTNVKP